MPHSQNWEWEEKLISLEKYLLRHDRHTRHDKNDYYDDSSPCSTRFNMRNPEHANGDNIHVSRSLKIEWLNSFEAAEYLRLSVKALRNKTSNGQIPFHKFGRLNRYRKDELDSLLLSNKRGQYGN